MTQKYHKKLQALPIPQVMPQGWLKKQMEIQMKGLTGRLYEVWDSVGSYSGWLGGTGENWERAPYYLDGLLPLAYYLKDEEHWKLACRFVEWTLKSQDEKGNFGPVESKEDYWSRFVMLKVLIQYYEIKKEQRVLEFFGKYFQYLYYEIRKRPMTQWSKARIGDLLYSISWYYEKNSNEYLLELVDILREQALDWVDILEEFPFVRPTAYYYDWKKIAGHYESDEFDGVMNYHTNHVVNVTMGFKYPAMLSYFYDDKDYEAISIKGMETVEKYHGVATGAINGDEHLSGNNPSQGSELCSVVEYMFSLETMLEMFGNPYFGDKLEKLAYNALPGTISEDFMSHQYLQQANQIICSKEKRNWFNNKEDSNLFGLEPNFGCCTANMHQGWPKFVKSLWYRENADTIISMVHAPCTLNTVVAGTEFKITQRTEYPFRSKITYLIEKGSNTDAILKIRIPGWCNFFSVYKNKEVYQKEKQGAFVCIKGLRQEDIIEIQFDMEIRKTYWFHNSMAVERGPLVYALDMEEQWVPIKEVAEIKDYEIHSKSLWNYAISENEKIVEEEGQIGEIPFSKQNVPVILKAMGKTLNNWTLENNSAGTLPVSPVAPEGEKKEIRLIPYGCTKLRITQFPYY